MTKKRVFSYLALIVVFIAIFSGSYYYKVSSDKRNITDSNILSTARNENPLYNQAIYQVEKVNEPLDEKNLIQMGNTLFVQKKNAVTNGPSFGQAQSYTAFWAAVEQPETYYTNITCKRLYNYSMLLNYAWGKWSL